MKEGKEEEKGERREEGGEGREGERREEGEEKARGGEGEERREDGSKGGDSKQNITQMSSTPLGNISVALTPTFPEWSTPHPGRMVFPFLFSMFI